MTSKEAIEQHAIELFLRHGYAATSIPMIAVASSVSRTSVFRYWRSKSDLVWGPFDTHIERLGLLLRGTSGDTPVMDAVREQVVENLRLSMVESASWLERFAVIDTAPELRGEEAEHWARWAEVITRFVAERLRLPSRSVAAAAVGGAIQGAFVSVLRGWLTTEDRSPSVLQDLDAALVPVCEAVWSLLPSEA